MGADMKYFLAVFICFSVCLSAAPLNTELVINGGAETGDLTGWTSTGINVVTASGFHAGFGSFTFTGGGGTASGQTLEQTIDLSANASDIDNGLITSTFSIFLQTRSSDIAEATISFLDGSNAVLASQFFIDTINPGSFDWNQFGDTRIAPVGTRSIRILLNSTRTGGSSSDGFFDEVSLQISSSAPAVPEPSSLLLIALGVVLFGQRYSRK